MGLVGCSRVYQQMEIGEWDGTGQSIAMMVMCNDLLEDEVDVIITDCCCHCA